MDDRHEIILTEAPTDGPPDLLEKLRLAIDELFESGVSAASNYVKGKGEQEIAKALEIKAKVMSQLGEIELERIRLVQERDRQLREDKIRMYELKTERLTAIVDCLLRIRELGARVSLRVISEKLISSIEE